MSPLLLTDLPWRDVIYQHIFPCITLKDLCKLRAVSKTFHSLFQDYMRVCKRLDFSFTDIESNTFLVITFPCKNLKYLSVCQCTNLSDEDVIPLLKANPKLNYLNLNGCIGFTTSVIRASAVNCLGLESLLLGKCPWLNKDGLEVILTHLTKLKCVDISQCYDVDQDTLNQLVCQYPDLKELHLNSIESVDESVLDRIASNCHKLEVLSLSKCWKVTSIGMKKILEYCPKLKFVDLRLCRGIDERWLTAMTNKGIKTPSFETSLRVHIGFDDQI